MIYEEQKNDFLISTDPARLDLVVIHRFLSEESYWSANIPFEKVKKSIENSFSFGLYKKDMQIGFARLITDRATYAYLADVFILPEYRGQGLSKWLVQFIIDNPEMKGLRRWALATKDAHGLYAQFGFTPYDRPDRLMEKHDPDVYKKKE